MQCLLSTTIMWKISTHMMPTCCPALFYEGHSCDTETGLFKGARDGHGGLVIFKSHSTKIKLIVMLYFSFTTVKQQCNQQKTILNSFI